ncbi:hypothetical protein ACLB2K_057864 [Fragaria x ananassa]
MASDGRKMPPQKQEAQPGKEHAMDPNPQFSNPDYKPSNKLQGMVALVTGADSGIGRSVSLLCSGGCNCGLHLFAADLGFDENCKRVVEEEVVKAYNRIDILVNNAAEHYKTGSVQDIDEARIERVFRTNIFACFFMARHGLKHMKEGSNIICTTSVVAYKGNPNLLDYTATKVAIVAFVRGLALELVNKGIRVNGVAPGPIWTPLIPADCLLKHLLSNKILFS